MIELKSLPFTKSHLRLFLLAILMAWFVSDLSPAPVFAQGTDLTLHTLDDTAFPQVQVVVSANEGTRPVKGLMLDDFTLAEDGKIVPIAGVSTLDSGQIGVSLILVLDVSLSMQANEGITEAKAAALSILDRMRPNDRVAVVAFSEGVVVDSSTLNPEREIAFTTDKAAIRTLITGLQAGGATALYDATLKGIRLSQDEPRGSRAMILLTDGRDERFEGEDRLPGSTFQDSDVILEARDTNMPIFTIGLGTNIDRSFLTRIADQSGGSFQEAPDPTQLETFFNNALDQLLQRYVIQYQSQVSPDTGSHVLLVQVGEGQNIASAQTTFASVPPEIPGIRLNLLEGEEVEGAIQIRPTVFAADPIAKVELLVDDQVLREDTTAPYVFSWNSATPAYENGSFHKVTVKATDTDGEVGETFVNVIVQIPPPTATPRPTSTATAGPSPTPPVTPTPGLPDCTITPLPLECTEAPPPFWLWVLGALAAGLMLVIGWLLMQRRDDDPPSYIPEPPPASPLPGPYTANPYPAPNVSDIHSGTGIGAMPPQYSPSQSRPTAPEPVGMGPTPTVSSFGGGMHDPSESRPDGTVILNRTWIGAQFVESQGQRVGRSYPLLNQHNPQHTKRVRIGRDPHGNDVVLDDPRISRQQAVLLYEKGVFTLFNNAIERNPILVQGRKIMEPMVLQDNDVVQMGNTQLRFLILRSG